MLRITEKLESEIAVRVRLDGSINTGSYPGLEELLLRYQGAEGKTIILDMAGVDFMSDDAARKLATHRGDGLRIINCSPFILMLLENLEMMESTKSENDRP